MRRIVIATLASVLFGAVAHAQHGSPGSGAGTHRPNTGSPG